MGFLSLRFCIFRISYFGFRIFYFISVSSVKSVVPCFLNLFRISCLVFRISISQFPDTSLQEEVQMAQKCILPSTILITIIILVSSYKNAKGYDNAEDYDPDINFWPVFYYNKGTDKNDKEIEVLYPFFHLKKNKDTSTFSFRPVYSVKKIPEEKYRKSEFLWPLSHATHTENRVYQRAFPFYSYERDTSGKIPEENTTFFPFFFKRTQNGKDFALFPFYGKFHHRFNQDTIQFILWPIYTKLIKDNRQTWNIIWPIFNYTTSSNGNEYGYKFWPFYGRHEKKEKYKKGFIMWPLYVYINAGINDTGEYKGWGTIPFYITEKTPVSDSKSVLWPLFKHIKDRQKGLERWDYPFPIATKIKSKERNKNAFLPFWSIDRTTDTKTLSLAYPLFWSIHYRAGDSCEIDTIRFLPFYWERHEYFNRDEKHGALRQIWPFYKKEKGSDSSTSLEVLSLYPLLDDGGWERNWKPFFHIYEQNDNKTTGVKTTRFLWRLYHHESSMQFSYREMAPFFSLYKNHEGVVYFSLLSNMIKYKKDKSGRYIKLFYLLKIPL